MKSQEQRIKDAAEAMLPALTGGYRQRAEEATKLAMLALEAADREPPTWPTDECLEIIWRGAWCGGPKERRLRVREALLADPILKAAIAYRDGNDGRRGDLVGGFGEALIDAVNEAGL